MSTTHQYKPTIAGVTLAETVKIAAEKYERIVAQPHSDRARAYAQRALQALKQFRVVQE